MMERLSEKEQKLYFTILLNKEGVFLADIHYMFEKKMERSYARTTILTWINRMEKKGYIRKEKIGRNSKVIPLVSRDDYIRSEIMEICDEAFDGDYERMISFIKRLN